jgi:hypothetical protein
MQRSRKTVRLLVVVLLWGLAAGAGAAQQQEPALKVSQRVMIKDAASG